jgi:hypothetical protein
VAVAGARLFDGGFGIGQGIQDMVRIREFDARQTGL